MINALMDKGHMRRRVTHEILRPMKFSLRAIVKDDPLTPSNFYIYIYCISGKKTLMWIQTHSA